MILKGYPRISETFISGEILGLEALGFRVRILSMRRPRESFTHASVGRIRARADYMPETIRGNALKLLAANLPLALARPLTYAKGLRQALARFVRTGKAASLKHLLQAGYLARKVLPGSGVTHLHAHFAHSPTSVAAYASLLTGLPFSFTAHAKDIYTQRPRALAEKLAKARFAVTCTAYNKRRLDALNPTRTPLTVVRHGIDLSLFTPGPARITPGAPLSILTVARLTPKKGLPTVFRALALLAEQGMDFRFRLVGEGEQRSELEALATSLGLDNRMDWLGTLPHERVVDLYRQADLFALGCEVRPNGDRDGIPNVLAEAMAMGVPVAATTVSGIGELIVSGRHGLLVPPQDPPALADAIRRLATDTGLRAQLIPAARRRVEAMFDNQALIRDLAAWFQENGVCA
ncbi:glycosyltransferase family 4 protein [Fundidesulfovibrio butyratiphilus]